MGDDHRQPARLHNHQGTPFPRMPRRRRARPSPQAAQGTSALHTTAAPGMPLPVSGCEGVGTRVGVLWYLLVQQLGVSLGCLG